MYAVASARAKSKPDSNLLPVESLEYVAGTVAQSAPLTPYLHRVVLHVPDLARLAIPDDADAAVGIYFSTGSTDPSGRTYTVRECDATARRVTVDVVIHGHGGVGAAWARRAAPGDQVGLAHANSWYRPLRAEWQVLAADLAGLPALARIIDELSPDAIAVAIAEVPDRQHADYLPKRDNVQLVTTVGTGNGMAESALARLVAEHAPTTGWGYCWLGGEATQARALRKYLRGERHWEADQLDVMGYWRRDADAWARRYARVGADLFEAYQRDIAAGKPEKVAAEEFDAALEQAGL
jgi:NADPH-dependent ferric siderophore reductase